MRHRSSLVKHRGELVRERSKTVRHRSKSVRERSELLRHQGQTVRLRTKLMRKRTETVRWRGLFNKLCQEFQDKRQGRTVNSNSRIENLSSRIYSHYLLAQKCGLVGICLLQASMLSVLKLSE